MRFSLLLTLVALVISTLSLQAQTDDKRLLQACEARIIAKYSRWRFAPVRSDVAKFAKSRNENPTIAYGDFDGDDRKDVALLIQDGPAPDLDYPGRLDSLHIAVCLSNTARTRLYLIDKPYCGDGITRAPKGRPYTDIEKDTEGSYKLDGIHAYCLEKAGATYEFENGTFHRIIDSD
jgi:hypothetical protein